MRIGRHQLMVANGAQSLGLRGGGGGRGGGGRGEGRGG